LDPREGFGKKGPWMRSSHQAFVEGKEYGMGGGGVSQQGSHRGVCPQGAFFSSKVGWRLGLASLQQNADSPQHSALRSQPSIIFFSGHGLAPSILPSSAATQQPFLTPFDDPPPNGHPATSATSVTPAMFSAPLPWGGVSQPVCSEFLRP